MGTLINDSDMCFMESIAREVNCLAGTNAFIFQFDEADSERDWVYAESVSKTFKKNKKGTEGINCPVLFKSPDTTSISGEEGFRKEKMATAFVTNSDLVNRGMRKPRIGDIWLLWGLYYDVTKESSTGGRYSDTGTTVEYEVSVVRRTKAVPEGMWFTEPPEPDTDAVE